MASILVLDDNTEICEFISDVLIDDGHEVLFFEDPTTAFLAGKNYKESIDMVIFDIELPKISGIEFTQLMQKIIPTQRFLCISGHVDEHQSALNGIHVSSLSKPFSREALVEIVTKVLTQLPPIYPSKMLE